jgi:chromate transporter
MSNAQQIEDKRGRTAEVFVAFLRLGCISFGGPVAHLGYFQAEFVEKRGWLSEGDFAELVAVAQSLPGPASSQVGYAIGLYRAGLSGGLGAWLGFTAPSAVLMLALAMGHTALNGPGWSHVLHGLQLAAVAVVAHAVISMREKLAADSVTLLLAAATLVFVLWTGATWSAVAAVGLGAIVGMMTLRREQIAVSISAGGISRRTGLGAAVIFVVLLLLSFVVPVRTPSVVGMSTQMVRTGAMVFGGGHVVLPVMQDLIVSRGWLSEGSFLTGYGAAQALPGPLFTLAAYVGASVGHSLAMGLLALAAIFLPGLLLMTAVLPFWRKLRAYGDAQAAMRGINAAVVGVLAAALWRPLVTSTVHSIADGVIAALGLLLLVVWKRPSYLVVGLAALFGWLWPMIAVR